MITVLFVSHSGSLLGSEKGFAVVARQLDRQRFHPIVVAPDDGMLAAELRQHGIEVKIVARAFAGTGWRTVRGLPLRDKLRFVGEFFAYVRTLRHLIRAERVDVVHVNTVMEPFAALAGWLARKPVAWHIHETPPARIFAFVGRMMRVLSTRIIVNSQATLERLPWRAQRDLDAGKIRLIYYGINFAQFGLDLKGAQVRRELGFDSQTPIVGFVGHLNHRKGVDVALRAAPEILAIYPEAKFVFAGEFSTAEFETEARALLAEHNLRDKVHLIGFRTDVPDVMDACDVLIVPSRHEPFGWVVIEGMATRTPVVASRVGGIREIVLDGETGYLIAPGDVGELAQAVCRLLGDPDLRTSMGAKGRQRVEEHFNEARFVETMGNIYAELAGER